jgi:4-hydroxythreonine-4-phosphate dehydrogenase
MALPALALTMGEPAGIGGELAMLAWQARERERIPPFFLLDDLGWSLPLLAIEDPSRATMAFETGLPILPLARRVATTAGKPSPDTAPAVIESIERAVTLTRDGEVAALVTNPISKQVLYSAGFHHPGHTEYLEELAGGGQRAVMMLVIEGLRAVPATIHLPMTEVAGSLRRDHIVEIGRITAAALVSDFRIREPCLAVAALNPHAGEGGTLGREEIEIIGPAVEALRAEGLDVEGPTPADTLFHAAARARYDAAICMYHDQALIPIKTLDFERGVNATLGLPFVRTSPDHGTALGIAGSGRCSPISLIAALKLAADMAEARSEHAKASITQDRTRRRGA